MCYDNAGEELTEHERKLNSSNGKDEGSDSDSDSESESESEKVCFYE